MTNILITDFITVLLIFMRVTAAFIAAPVFGHKAFPVLPKIFLGMVLSYIIFLSVDFSYMQVKPELSYLFINGIKEILTGLLIGFTLNLVFYGVSYAGTFIGFDMGLAMADIFNPSEETNQNIIGEFLHLAAILVFLLINGHHYLVRGLAHSFHTVNIGKFGISSALYTELVKLSGEVFIIAVKIASPVMISFFLVHIAEGIIARVIPQMQIFFVNQPLKIGLGFLLLTSLIPIYIYLIKYLLHSYEDKLYTVVKALGS